MVNCLRLVVLGLLLAYLLAGCSAEPETPEASAPPKVNPLVLPFEPDLLLVRVFADEDGTLRTCEIRIAAVADPATGDADNGRLADAHAFLRNGDWSAIEPSLADIPTDQLEIARDRGMGDAELLMSVLSEHIIDDYRAAGYLGNGVSVQSFNRCLGG